MGFANDDVPGSIQKQRILAIESTLAIVHNFINQYSGPDIVCHRKSFSCDARLLGSLLKASAIIGILAPARASLSRGQIEDTSCPNSRIAGSR